MVQRSVNKLVHVTMPTWHHHKPQFHNNSLKKPPKPNQILKNYVDAKNHTKVLLHFKHLLSKRTTSKNNSIDSFSFLFALKSCINHKHPSIPGKQLHAQIVKFGYRSVVQLQTSLMKVYAAEGGSLRDARQVFDEMPSKNIVCWTSLISAYVDNRRPAEALRVFRAMMMTTRAGGVEPDQVAVTVALSACADTGELETGERIHDFVRRKRGLKRDLCLNNALIDMYAKCGDIVTARRLFESTGNKDVTTWTSMIVGHALHGQAHEALQLFSEMNLVTPNDVTFVGVLMACSHAGLVEEGKQHFRSMTEDYGIQPREAHFGCMVDLLCRGGHLRDARDFIMGMPTPANAVIWRTLLGACGLHGELELAAEIRQKLLELEPDYVGDSVTMSNIYADKGMWSNKMIVRNHIKQSRAPGCSSIEVGSCGN